MVKNPLWHLWRCHSTILTAKRATLGQPITFSPKWDCQHYSSRHVSGRSHILVSSVFVVGKCCMNCVDSTGWVSEWLSGHFVPEPGSWSPPHRALVSPRSQAGCWRPSQVCGLAFVWKRLPVGACLATEVKDVWHRSLRVTCFVREPMARHPKAASDRFSGCGIKPRGSGAGEIVPAGGDQGWRDKAHNSSLVNAH